MKKTKQFFASVALVMFITMTTATTVDARPVYIESGSYVDSKGCIHIVYEVQHRFLGINWYTTEEDVTEIC